MTARPQSLKFPVFSKSIILHYSISTSLSLSLGNNFSNFALLPIGINISRVSQPRNAKLSIVFIVSGSIILFNDLQPQNALSPIDITEAGITILLRDSQFQNAIPSIEVIGPWIIIFFRQWHQPKVPPPIVVTDFGITISSISLSQNASFPIEFTESGITISFSELPLNVASPIEVTESGIRNVSFLEKQATIFLMSEEYKASPFTTKLGE